MIFIVKTPSKSEKTPNVKKCMEFAIYSQSLGLFKLEHDKRDRKETKFFNLQHWVSGWALRNFSIHVTS